VFVEVFDLSLEVAELVPLRFAHLRTRQAVVAGGEPVIDQAESTARISQQEKPAEAGQIVVLDP
jgi:hypothetical protein